ncbi:germination protein [Lederbergia ruris]|uniref:Germination protein n=1 Tax=Lederbergia ruris TaxID=217495 RepID=A0ABQ4KKH8_9BACI|nr:GerAB/ArcD/ProY family transporter [Lederbergia ruris]GIN57956.1 germination protein [Lederbergia ruris]
MIGKKEITQFQLIFLLIHSQVGVGVITLPFDVFMEAKGDGWISVLLTGAFIQIMIFLFGALMVRFPTNNLYGIVQSLFGKWIGKLFVFLYSMYFIAIGGLILAKFAYILKAWMMPLTPKWLLLLLMVFTAVYIVKENLQLMVRFFFLSTIVLIGFIGLTAYALKDANLTFILPIGTNGVLPIIQGMERGLYAFQGFELLLIIYPFVQSKKKGVIKAATMANIFTTLFYSFLVLTSLLFFSPEEFKLVPEPVLYLIKAFSFRIIERPDLLFTSMWIVLAATAFMNTIYASSLGLSTVMNSNKIRNYVIIAACICFLLALTFHETYEIATISRIYNNFVVFPFALGLPILFLLISIIFNKKELRNSG